MERTVALQGYAVARRRAPPPARRGVARAGWSPRRPARPGSARPRRRCRRRPARGPPPRSQVRTGSGGERLPGRPARRSPRDTPTAPGRPRPGPGPRGAGRRRGRAGGPGRPGDRDELVAVRSGAVHVQAQGQAAPPQLDGGRHREVRALLPGQRPTWRGARRRPARDRAAPRRGRTSPGRPRAAPSPAASPRAAPRARTPPARSRRSPRSCRRPAPGPVEHPHGRLDARAEPGARAGAQRQHRVETLVRQQHAGGARRAAPSAPPGTGSTCPTARPTSGRTPRAPP